MVAYWGRRVNSRDKGKRAERAMVKEYQKLGFKATRTAPLQAGGGHEGAADVGGVPGIHIEVKHVEALNIWKALEQSERDCAEGSIATVHFKRNRTGWYVALSFSDFAGLLEEAGWIVEELS